MAALHRWLRGLLFQLLALITQVQLPAAPGRARGTALACRLPVTLLALGHAFP